MDNELYKIKERESGPDGLKFALMKGEEVVVWTKDGRDLVNFMMLLQLKEALSTSGGHNVRGWLARILIDL